jgi:hypothetical protein
MNLAELIAIRPKNRAGKLKRHVSARCASEKLLSQEKVETARSLTLKALALNYLRVHGDSRRVA